MAVNSVSELMNETARQQARDAQAAREASFTDGSYRKAGGEMGKNDFLLLLATQLRYQDPLDPASQSDFAAQLAQFTALEQMQNMNTTLASMATYQAYSLIGKLVYAQESDGADSIEYYGVVDSVYTRNGVTYAMIQGYDYGVPVSAILEVFDNTGFVNPESFIQTSGNIIGRTVKAQVGNSIFEGIVTRLAVEDGYMYAYIDDGSGAMRIVPIGSIFDIGMTVAANTTETMEPPPVVPPPEEEPPPVDPPPEEEPPPVDPPPEEEPPPVDPPPEEQPPPVDPPPEEQPPVDPPPVEP